jgi:hypothetical protein
VNPLKQLYQEIEKQLLAGKVIKQVQVYANQINRLVGGKNNTGVVRLPAALVEFTNVQYFDMGNGDQQFTATCRIYTVVYDLVNPGLKIFDAMDAVHAVVQNINTTQAVGLRRVADDTDNDFENTCVNITDYQFRASCPVNANQTVTIRNTVISGKTGYIV